MNKGPCKSKIISIILMGVFLFNPLVFAVEACLRPVIGKYERVKRACDIAERNMLKAGFPNPEASVFTQTVQSFFYDKGYMVYSEVLGQGFRANVYLAENILVEDIGIPKFVAIKIPNPYGYLSSLELFLEYCLFMRDQIGFWKRYNIIKHQFSSLIQLYEAGFIPVEEIRKNAILFKDKTLFEMREGNLPYQIMDVIEGKDIKELLNEEFFKGKDISILIKSIVDFIYGIDKMHKKGITHGALLPKNVLIDQTTMTMKACDLDHMDNFDGFSQDRLSLHNLAEWILYQASRGSDNLDTIHLFFSKTWKQEATMRNGLEAFAQELLVLRESILPNQDSTHTLEQASGNKVIHENNI